MVLDLADAGQGEVAVAFELDLALHLGGEAGAVTAALQGEVEDVVAPESSSHTTGRPRCRYGACSQAHHCLTTSSLKNANRRER